MARVVGLVGRSASRHTGAVTGGGRRVWVDRCDRQVMAEPRPAGLWSLSSWRVMTGSLLVGVQFSALSLFRCCIPLQIPASQLTKALGPSRPRQFRFLSAGRLGRATAAPWAPQGTVTARLRGMASGAGSAHGDDGGGRPALPAGASPDQRAVEQWLRFALAQEGRVAPHLDPASLLTAGSRGAYRLALRHLDGLPLFATDGALS